MWKLLDKNEAARCAEIYIQVLEKAIKILTLHYRGLQGSVDTCKQTAKPPLKPSKYFSINIFTIEGLFMGVGYCNIDTWPTVPTREPLDMTKWNAGNATLRKTTLFSCLDAIVK